VKCRFNPSRVVQPGCTNAQYARGRAITAVNGSKEIGLFCRSHWFALYSPTIQQASRAGQESFTSIAAIHCAEGCALVTQEFRSSPEANIEDRLSIALFHACRRGWIGNLVCGCSGFRFVLLDFGLEDASLLILMGIAASILLFRSHVGTSNDIDNKPTTLIVAGAAHGEIPRRRWPYPLEQPSRARIQFGRSVSGVLAQPSR
jgi:hypothetical protein